MVSGGCVHVAASIPSKPTIERSSGTRLIATLWLGLYYRQVGDEDGARRCVEYTLARQTELGLLPEQVTLDGRPAWVLPLAWSHAMLLLAAGPELAIVRD